MKKNEYLTPEVEILKITEQCGILAGSDQTGNNAGGDGDDGDLDDWFKN